MTVFLFILVKINFASNTMICVYSDGKLVIIAFKHRLELTMQIGAIMSPTDKAHRSLAPIG